jgi:serine/threonine protein kinase
MSVISAGKSLVIDRGDCIAKIFNTVQNEHDILKEINSKRVIEIVRVEYNPFTIFYKKVIPITRPPSDLKKYITDIALSLIDIHDKGYVHGDVYHKNIGMNDKGHYILFDFEFCKKSTDYYSDIAMFLSDLKRMYRDSHYVTIIQKEMEKFIERKEVTISFLGRKRKRIDTYCNYKIYDFYKVINEISNIEELIT